MPYKDPEKQREYQRDWMAKRRAEYLKDKKCAHCGSTENLEIDHINPADKWTHKVWSYCKTKRNKELAKCQVLCSSCHMKKTANDILEMKTRAHGSLEGYEKWHCRCDDCSKFADKSNDQRFAGISIATARELVLV